MATTPPPLRYVGPKKTIVEALSCVWNPLGVRNREVFGTSWGLLYCGGAIEPCTKPHKGSTTSQFGTLKVACYNAQCPWRDRLCPHCARWCGGGSGHLRIASSLALRQCTVNVFPTPIWIEYPQLPLCLSLSITQNLGTTTPLCLLEGPSLHLPTISNPHSIAERVLPGTVLPPRHIRFIMPTIDYYDDNDFAFWRRQPNRDGRLTGCLKRLALP